MEFMFARQSLRRRDDTARDCLGGATKRIFDIVFASLFLGLTLPILLVAAAALKLAGADPIISREPRLGFRGRSFTVVEFTTTAGNSPVSQSAAATGRKFRSRTGAACIGAFLRESGIHKLPLLVNVLRGEMSLVGPRALLPSEASPHGDRIAAYLTARPGFVQPPKIANPGNRRAGELLDPDLDYVRNWRFSTDVVALLRTIFAMKVP